MEKTFYYRYDSGALEELTVTVADEDEQVPAPPGATEISREEYEQEFAALEAANEERAAEQRAQEEAAKKAAYEALIAAGIPEASAQQLSGYRPPEEPADPPE